jgi:hypothetical protein
MTGLFCLDPLAESVPTNDQSHELKSAHFGRLAFGCGEAALKKFPQQRLFDTLPHLIGECFLQLKSGGRGFAAGGASGKGCGGGTGDSPEVGLSSGIFRTVSAKLKNCKSFGN